MNNVFTQILEDAQAIRNARQQMRNNVMSKRAELPEYTQREILRQKLREVAAEAFGKDVPEPRVYPSPFSKDHYRR